jgi:predicted ferric reductase
MAHTSIETTHHLLASVRRRKAALVALIALTALLPPLFIQFNEPSAELTVYKVLAKCGSLSGTVLLVWQFLLGYRGVVSRVVVDLIWVVKLHQALGTYGTAFILLHPLFITLYYLRKHSQNLWTLDFSTSFQVFVGLGIVALALLLIITVTSVFLRQKIRYVTWYFTHLASYILLPIVFVHSFAIGMTVRDTALRFGWIGLTIVAAAFYLYRIVARLGLMDKRYEIVTVDTVSRGTSEITMLPVSKRIYPHIGQFVYFRRSRQGRASPYTVSHHDDDSGEIRVAVKAKGKTSTKDRQVAAGDHAFLDGPYGVFTWEALASKRPVVMVAGGIGITAFRRLIRELADAPREPSFLFYGSKHEEEISFREELERMQHVRVVHVVSDQTEFAGEKGFVSVDLIRTYAGEDLARYEFLLCGPPVMIRLLEPQLMEQGVPPEQIHHELFGL